MQNRLIFTGIPSTVPTLPNSTHSLRDLVEEHACWVDRFAFLPTNEENESTCVAAAELHIENVRDRAIKSLDRLTIFLTSNGDVHASHKNDTEFKNKWTENKDGKKLLSFQIRAFPANLSQSKRLIELSSPLDSDLEDAEKKMESQLLKLPCEIELVVQRSNEAGGTGTNPWRGGVILAAQICVWFNSIVTEKLDDNKFTTEVDFMSLFKHKSVLELGAGSAGLPSMALGKIMKHHNCDMNLISSDGIDEIVTALKRNIRENCLHDFIQVQHIDWNCLHKLSQNKVNCDIKADTIIFSDCVYNEDGASALFNAICAILKRKGNVVGVLPDFRVGLDLFENMMETNNFKPTVIPHGHLPKGEDFTCSGGGGKNYRLIHWIDNRPEE